MGSVFTKILILLGTFIVSWLLLVVIVTFLGFDNATPTASLIEGIGAIFFTFIPLFIMESNKAQKLKALVPKLRADIDIAEQTKLNLLAQATVVVKSHLEHEENTFVKVSEARSAANSSDLLKVVESYPMLAADKSIMDLLGKIQTCEVNLMRQKQSYTSAVAEYNAKIHQFPLSIVRKLSKLEDIDIDKSISDKDI